MLVISRKNGQKIMINDNIVITVVEVKNGQCKIAIEADRDVKIYREEIYYQVKLANLVGKNTNINLVDSVDNLLKHDKIQLNDSATATHEDAGFEVDKPKSSKSIIINKQNNSKDI
jgi:carbon storage regulator